MTIDGIYTVFNYTSTWQHQWGVVGCGVWGVGVWGVGGDYVPGIPGACVIHNFTHLIRGHWSISSHYNTQKTQHDRIILAMHSIYHIPHIRPIWASWRLKLTGTRLFVQQLAQANNKRNYKVLYYFHLWRESTGNRWPVNKFSIFKGSEIWHELGKHCCWGIHLSSKVIWRFQYAMSRLSEFWCCDMMCNYIRIFYK